MSAAKNQRFVGIVNKQIREIIKKFHFARLNSAQN